MKKATLIAIAILVSVCSLANASSKSQLNGLGSAFKSDTHSSAVPVLNSNDITMGYAGEDVAKTITLGTEAAA